MTCAYPHFRLARDLIRNHPIKLITRVVAIHDAPVFVLVAGVIGGTCVTSEVITSAQATAVVAVPCVAGVGAASAGAYVSSRAAKHDFEEAYTR
jgi:hypothetical protein